MGINIWKLIYLSSYQSSHSVSNPDLESERRLLAQLAPELDEDTLRRLVGAFHDLRTGYDEGKLSYPYSLRGAPNMSWVRPTTHVDTELINLVRHMRTYTSDTLDATLRNVFDFDVYKPETIDVLSDILEHHGSVRFLILLTMYAYLRRIG